ncbi:MAG: hypothetical protein JRJ06_02865 [Deltaproteobacteria bacterium]|nr:hypothetical protein [Deltaproteobacteria bacterium]
MKKVSLIVITLFLVSIVASPIVFAQPPGGKKGGPPGGKKGPPPKISHEDFVKMYDRDGNGEVSMDEFLEGPKDGPPGGKKGPPPGGKKGPPGGKKGPK